MGVSRFLQENASYLVVNDIDTARNVLTTLIAGGLSMLVFSFSMVMLLLSQAAANYSPRVLPSLISNRRHQTILGTFLAMILYNIITVIGLQPHGDDYQLPGFSVLIGIAFAVLALAAFVYFIHSISSSIQINNILENIYSLSRKRLLFLVEENRFSKDFEDTDDWHTIKTNRSGTIQNMSITGLKELARESETKFDILMSKGEYLFEHQPLVKSKKELDESELEELFKNFNYTESELVSDNYIIGFKQITEIGIKAMSPGINDPGTALDTIHYLTELFALRMQKGDIGVVEDEDGNPVINLKVIDFKTLMYNVLAPFRTYCKHDITVMQKLLGMIAYLKTLDAANDSFYQVLDREATMMIQDVNSAIENPIDLEVLQGIYDRMNIQET
ncbi:hypothetical protein NMS_2550 [Nonlabens marinus S1-08]|uniref:DUF2254 domain-containing protein n=2 Tax=Nonlabens TaxID=363408 RepID=W8VRY9_9FLAO|nr:hypothetical protein NMS_2550 [Nonlabens marinus S1-08]